MMKKAELLTTCFGLGRIPFAPGTFGSLPPVLVYLLAGYFCPYPPSGPILMAFLAATAAWVCVQFAPAIIAETGKTDPQTIVADEVAGQAVAMLFIAILDPANIWLAGAAGFVLFRLFDILKPWPCKKLEYLPRGAGILADDLMAGIYAAVVFGVLYGLWPEYFG